MKPQILLTITAQTSNTSLRTRIKMFFEEGFDGAETFNTTDGFTFVDSQITPAYDSDGYRPGFPMFDIKLVFATMDKDLAKQYAKNVEAKYPPAKCEITMPKESKDKEEFTATMHEQRAHHAYRESTYGRAMKYMEEHDTGTISAFHGHGLSKTPKGYKDIADDSSQKINSNYNIRNKNRLASKHLGEDLKKLGYTYFTVGGSFIEEYSADGEATENFKRNEWTYFVVDQNDTGNLKRDLIKLGRKYQQEYILFVEKGSKEGKGYKVGFYKQSDYTSTKIPKDSKVKSRNEYSYGTLHHNEPNEYGDTQIRGKKYSFK